MEKTIFVVDDVHTNLQKAQEALGEHYNLLTIASGEKALKLLKTNKPDLILLDIEMPGMDGFEVLSHIKSMKEYADIPIIFLTGTSKSETESAALGMGVVDFITKPFSTPVLLNRIRVHLDIADTIKARTEDLRRSKQGIIFVLADLVEHRDESTGKHLERTCRLVRKLVESMQKEKLYYDLVRTWSPSEMAECSMLHDVGKIKIPDTILNKPGRLTKEEYEVIKTHVQEGEDIIKKMIDHSGNNEFLNNSINFAAYHHERWDGTGYPFGLKGEEIPLQGRIMAVVDVYDALTSKRVYKDAMTDEEAMEIIQKDSGSHFDPNIVDIFSRIENRLKANT